MHDVHFGCHGRPHIGFNVYFPRMYGLDLAYGWWHPSYEKVQLCSGGKYKVKVELWNEETTEWPLH